jgi:anthranilate synthase component 1
MFYPDLQEFIEKSKEGNLIPVYREILADLDTPLAAFLKLKGKIGFLFESVEGGEKWARYSFLGSDPSVIIEGKGKSLTIKRGNKKEKIRTDKNPLEIVSTELGKYKPIILPQLPRFFGGFVGYIGYDMVRHFEKLPDKHHKGLNLQDMFLMLTDTFLVFDNLTQKIKVISNAHIEGDPAEAYEKAKKKIDKIIKKLKSKVTLPKNIFPNPVQRTPQEQGESGFSSNVTKAGFLNAVEKAKEYVRAGDVIQVVLSQNFQRAVTTHPINVYRALRVINPSPYMIYLNTGKCTLETNCRNEKERENTRKRFKT